MKNDKVRNQIQEDLEEIALKIFKARYMNLKMDTSEKIEAREHLARLVKWMLDIYDNGGKAVTPSGEYEDEILELIYHADEFTTSDLQGAVTVLVNKIRRN